jgi:hypothetical protein
MTTENGQMPPTLEQLKAQAYDCMVQVAIWQRKVQEIEQQIVALVGRPKEPPA